MMKGRDKIKENTQILAEYFMYGIVRDDWEPYNNEAHTNLLILQLETEGWELEGLEFEYGYTARFCREDYPVLPWFGAAASNDLLEAVCDAAMIIYSFDVVRHLFPGLEI